VNPTVETILVFLGWTVLRIGLPVLLTAILVLWLRQLDARWKEEAILEGEGVEGATPCWEVNDCPSERRAHCPAYLHQEVACWQLFRAPDGGLRPACLECEVFRTAPVILRTAHRTVQG
jgi:hypothetical protein